MNYKHGKVDSPEYRTWTNMVTRCTNQKNHAYKNYGGRGITVCKRWMTFFNFYSDMGERPKGTSLDRIDNNGNYEPGNCRWATLLEQRRNSRALTKLTYKGRTLCIAEWAVKTGIKRTTLQRRIFDYGWPISQALTTKTMTHSDAGRLGGHLGK